MLCARFFSELFFVKGWLTAVREGNYDGVLWFVTTEPAESSGKPGPQCACLDSDEPRGDCPVQLVVVVQRHVKQLAALETPV